MQLRMPIRNATSHRLISISNPSKTQPAQKLYDACAVYGELDLRRASKMRQRSPRSSSRPRTTKKGRVQGFCKPQSCDFGQESHSLGIFESLFSLSPAFRPFVAVLFSPREFPGPKSGKRRLPRIRGARPPRSRGKKWTKGERNAGAV